MAHKLVEKEIERLTKENNGVCTPKLVLESARDSESPIHDRFEWDDSKAAEAHRLLQARELITSVRIVFQDKDEKPIRVRAYVSLASDRVDPEAGYRDIRDVMSNPDLRAELLRTALAELNALRKKYADLSELSGVFAALDKVAS